jgi:hypothetical protein
MPLVTGMISARKRRKYAPASGHERGGHVRDGEQAPRCVSSISESPHNLPERRRKLVGEPLRPEGQGRRPDSSVIEPSVEARALTAAGSASPESSSYSAPLTPSATTSRAPPRPSATTGAPHASASTEEMPKSSSPGCTYAAHVR